MTTSLWTQAPCLISWHAFAEVLASPINASYIPRLWYLVPETSESGIRCQEEGSKPWGIVLLGACIDAGPQPGAGELRPGKAVIPAGRPIAERVRRMGQQVTVGEPVQRARGQQTLDL